jgi:predicted RNA binding protein YcfA (HicA-like mRNA interferase family)
MKVRQILKILRKDGWYIDHYTGSHRQMLHPTKPGKVTVAGKPNETLHPKIVRSILKQAQIEEP